MIAPDLGSLTLRRVTTQRLDAYDASLVRERELSPSSVRHVHAVLRGALGQAVRWGWIPTNPAASASPPKVRRREITPPAITDARARSSLQRMSMTSISAPSYEYSPATSARRGEACGLRWSDIDAGSRTLSIQRSVASVSGGTIVKDTKTHAARRIALDTDTLTVLATHHQRMQRRALLCRHELDPDGFVFTTTADGSQPLHPDTITGTFSRLCRAAGLSSVRLHDLRHLHATQLLAAGVPVRTLSGRLGHANAATTLSVYAHFLEASDRDAADVIGGLLQPP